MLNRCRLYRERGWELLEAASYRETWQRYGGSVITHPLVVERLSALAGIPVRYLGRRVDDQLVAAIPTWGRHLALSRRELKRRGQRNLFDLGNAEVILPVAPGAQIASRWLAPYKGWVILALVLLFPQGIAGGARLRRRCQSIGST